MQPRPPDFLIDRLLYRDGLILVLDKPAGLQVHAGPQGGTSLEDYVDALRFGLPNPPHLAHRLDRDTSGCLVLGRHKKALRRLGRLFESGEVEKVYWAIAEGRMDADEGRIDQPLRKRSTKARGWWMEAAPEGEGQRAVTDYRVVARGATATLVECRPRTGRTHQLRVHLAGLGHPIRGDAAYGAGPGDAPLLLHAKALSLPLYPTPPPLLIEAPLPEPFRRAMAELGLEPPAAS
jgi:tRNA pseudouridine32 synthase / 23S rRNA pseudouridine746 synthase